MITIDLNELLPAEAIVPTGPEFVEAILDDVAALARARWIRLAQTQLHSSKRDYINGIQEVSGKGGERWITLLGRLPNMVEQGIDGWDLRETLLGEGKGKVSKDGHRYRAIPFRHGTPGSQGQAGTPVGLRYGPQGPQSRAWAAQGHVGEGMAAQLGQAVYAQAKRLRGQRRLPNRTYVDLGHLPGGHKRVAVPLLAPWHSTDIYAGMKRTEKKYRVATQGQYTTFRMISEANPTGWIHPGITARNLHQQVEREVSGLLTQVVAAALRGAARGRGV